MVYFENAFRWSFFHHNLKMHGPAEKKKLQFYVLTQEEITVCQITSDDPGQEGFFVGGALTKYSADVGALLLRHRSRTRLQINACQNCSLPPSYVQLGTLTH
jgi:hypothetical protein